MGPCCASSAPICTSTSLLHAGRLLHARGAVGAARALDFTDRAEAVLVAPAHAEHHVGAACQAHDALARLGVAREHDRALGAVEPVGERVEERLASGAETSGTASGALRAEEKDQRTHRLPG
jgi:hypothetical protein